MREKHIAILATLSHNEAPKHYLETTSWSWSWGYKVDVQSFSKKKKSWMFKSFHWRNTLSVLDVQKRNLGHVVCFILDIYRKSFFLYIYLLLLFFCFESFLLMECLLLVMESDLTTLCFPLCVAHMHAGFMTKVEEISI